MAETLTTQALIEQVQQGNRTALEDLCSRYQMRVLAAVRIRLGAGLRRKVESWDIVQEVMIDALSKVDSFDFRSEGAFLKYLNQVVENRIRDQADRWKADRRNADREISLEANRSPDSSNPLDLPDAQGAPTPSQVFALSEDLLRLEQALDQLAEDRRELLVAIKLEERTYGELAEELGISPDALRMKVNRAMLELAKVYRQGDGGTPDG